jgi:hypothetical protein
MNNLAIILTYQDQYEKAEQLHRQALGLEESVLCGNHPEIVNSIDCLIYVLRY